VPAEHVCHGSHFVWLSEVLKCSFAHAVHARSLVVVPVVET
jgi:hypothetical protein